VSSDRGSDGERPASHVSVIHQTVGLTPEVGGHSSGTKPRTHARGRESRVDRGRLPPRLTAGAIVHTMVKFLSFHDGTAFDVPRGPCRLVTFGVGW
jgi:hypothetical protein